MLHKDFQNYDLISVHLFIFIFIEYCLYMQLEALCGFKPHCVAYISSSNVFSFNILNNYLDNI